MEKQEPFEIGGEKIRPGSRRVIRIPISMFPDHPAFFLSLYVIHGKLPGKTLFVSSTIHGDELNGIAVVKHVISSNHTKNLKGTLILAPVVNMIGALIKSRYLADRRDLNRSFPGIEKGSQASQLAYTFFHEVVKKCTHGIDIHTGSDNRINLPQVRSDLENEETRELAIAFGAPVVLKAKLREGSLRSAAEKEGIVMIIFEGGESFRFDTFAVRVATRGVFRVMAHLGMIDKSQCPVSKVPTVISSASRWIRSPNAGVFHAQRGLGQKVLKGCVLGDITDYLGISQTKVRANFDGIVIGRTQLPLVFQGDALFNIACVSEPEKAEEIILGLEEDEINNLPFDDPNTF
ncbi:MAG: hypothetical protein ACD_16C00109G0003 [uncultured bacterium]|nr:MAG: hypothetical protein ACD_16C00109G0003 [uncultured bacterium]OFW68986.1 MAG: hypothetical protein A2X70_00575 [Alphaproteobacteria bacterium GWC2_42_16]OFW73818.1 MAG: hypothetical protein A2Z80_05825 [Alphaproteobacteria bacterium GWA2_41_27]OFW82100.1 MAG: hypothetical protein A3E50_06635 [Alphaproteobacteria bacterium RIFCSPHIGHO2_12_FULL_42_100]OFW86323.1 MAG: hypothetical protein A2W06_03215 [Alphaproteobacteria bacterium RBG_16_42_14]OFW91241.1 MAG: hypothetical protein A3C41_062